MGSIQQLVDDVCSVHICLIFVQTYTKKMIFKHFSSLLFSLYLFGKSLFFIYFCNIKHFLYFYMQ